MQTVFVQFADSTDKAIISWFGSPQNPDDFPNYGTVQTDDPRYLAFYEQCYPGGPPPFIVAMPEPVSD